MTLTPMMASGIYNGMQTKSMTVSVESNIIPDPITTTFSVSTTTERIPDGVPISFSWATEKSAGANLQISCNENISVLFTVGSASSTPKCGVIAFDPRISASGTGTVVFTNKSAVSEQITIMLVPERKTGGFDATRGKDISFWIVPKTIGASATVATPTSSAIPTVTQASIQTSSPLTTTSAIGAQTTSPQAKKIFTKPLARGSFGAEVRALQEFLKKNPAFYPEGIVNGNFGPATARAVKRLQEKYGLASTKTPGYGSVGPKTRALLNSLAKGTD
ncbi:MAG: peptidoglycan-binding protein [Candidatus Yonathbacteria bacterium]|nr:peptidoglycan-binding protein [Candidatus Yonathbacteria bacterium]